MTVLPESMSRETVRETGSVGPWIWAHRVSCFPPVMRELTVTAKILQVEKILLVNIFELTLIKWPETQLHINNVDNVALLKIDHCK